jgi:hypothetical protein
VVNRKELEEFAKQIRIETIRQIGNLGFGHIGGCMSVVELLAVLYGGAMKVDPENPKWNERDWLVVSMGHAGPAVYSTLALKGFFEKEILSTLNQGGTILPSHCDRSKTPGIDMTTGSLGQGISAALGVALRGLGADVRGLLTALAFTAVLLPVGGQTAWMLRPFLGRPAKSEFPFVRASEGSFAEAAVRSAFSSMGVYAHSDEEDETWGEDAGGRAP